MVKLLVCIFHESLIITVKISHNFSLRQVLQFIYWLTFYSGIFTEYNERHFYDIFGIYLTVVGSNGSKYSLNRHPLAL